MYEGTNLFSYRMALSARSLGWNFRRVWVPERSSLNHDDVISQRPGRPYERTCAAAFGSSLARQTLALQGVRGSGARNYSSIQLLVCEQPSSCSLAWPSRVWPRETSHPVSTQTARGCCACRGCTQHKQLWSGDETNTIGSMIQNPLDLNIDNIGDL